MLEYIAVAPVFLLQRTDPLNVPLFSHVDQQGIMTDFRENQKLELILLDGGAKGCGWHGIL